MGKVKLWPADKLQGECVVSLVHLHVNKGQNFTTGNYCICKTCIELNQAGTCF